MRTSPVIPVALVVMASAIPGCSLLDERGAPSDGAIVLVDERAGVLGGVRLGDSEATVRERRGAPTDDAGGFFPQGARFTGPPSIPAPTSVEDRATRPGELHYDDDAYLVSPTAGVFALATVDDRAETRGGVGVGDDLAQVRRRYDGVTCGEAPAGEGVFGRMPTYPWCRLEVGRVAVFFGEDPIESITLTRRARGD